MADAVAHAYVVPWPMGSMHTWCGRPLIDPVIAGDLVAVRPESVTCARCAHAMRAALAELSAVVPRLSGDEP